MAKSKKDKKKSKSKDGKDSKTPDDGDLELVPMGKTKEEIDTKTRESEKETVESKDSDHKDSDKNEKEKDGSLKDNKKSSSNTETANSETTWTFDSTGKMTIHTAPTDSKAQNGVPTSCGGKTLFYGSIVWLILVAIGIEILCLFMGTCFAYDNPSVSVVVTGAIFPLFVVVALVATGGIITAQGIQEDVLKTESRSRQACRNLSVYLGIAVIALIALGYFTAVSLQGVVAVSAQDAVTAGLALTWDSLTFQQQRLFDDDEDAFNEAKQTNMVVVAAFGMTLVINSFLVVWGCASEVSRIAKTLEVPQLP